MKVLHFIILAAIIGCCLPTAQVVGNNTGLAHTPADSIIVSNTPNGENKDFFEIKSKEDNLVSLKIFDRSGTLVYRTEAKKCGWNGRSSSGEKMDGVYFYIAEVSEVSPKITERGTFTLRQLSKNDL